MYRQLKGRVQPLLVVAVDLRAKLLQILKETEDARSLDDQGVGAACFLTDGPIVVHADVWWRWRKPGTYPHFTVLTGPFVHLVRRYPHRRGSKSLPKFVKRQLNTVIPVPLGRVASSETANVKPYRCYVHNDLPQSAHYAVVHVLEPAALPQVKNVVKVYANTKLFPGAQRLGPCCNVPLDARL